MSMPTMQTEVPEGTRTERQVVLMGRNFTDPYTSLMLGAAEIAILLDVQPGTVSQWKFRRILPEADYVLHCGDLWTRHTIERWARMTGRWELPDGASADLHIPEGWVPPNAK